MWPPSSEDSLLARSTIARAFQRFMARMLCSTAWSPGYGSSRSGGMVFRYGVAAEYGTGTCLRRLSASSESSSCSARSVPSNSSTESSASSHSLVSAGSGSTSMAPLPQVLVSGLCRTRRVPENEPAKSPPGAAGRPSSPALAGVEGTAFRLGVVAEYGRFNQTVGAVVGVEHLARVLQAEAGQIVGEVVAVGGREADLGELRLGGQGGRAHLEQGVLEGPAVVGGQGGRAHLEQGVLEGPAVVGGEGVHERGQHAPVRAGPVDVGGGVAP